MMETHAEQSGKVGKIGLESVSVRGLFGRFDHKISVNKAENLLIITAPNGYGKTILLRIIHSFFTRNLTFFQRLDFSEIEITFMNGQAARVVKGDQPELFATDPGRGPGREPQRLTFLPVGFAEAEKETFTYSFEATEKLHRLIDRRLPVHRAGPDRWIDARTDEILTTEQVVEVYGDALPGGATLKIPTWLNEATSYASAHLIETQRLLSLEIDDLTTRYARRPQMRSETVVEKDATDLSEKIGRVVNRYAIESQKLDQTFPKRVIEQRHGAVSGEVDIRQKLQSLSEKRENLVSAGLIGESVGEPISPADDLSDEDIRRILSIYVGDTEEKLSVFDDLYARVSLFKSIINEHFLFKEIVVDQAEGIAAKDLGTKKPIRLSELSSGEQHELVLIYELLFKVGDGSIILIDEPELSLHVAWQKRFISDIQKIQRLRSLQFIIATHSPQIINDQWDLVEELS